MIRQTQGGAVHLCLNVLLLCEMFVYVWGTCFSGRCVWLVWLFSPAVLHSAVVSWSRLCRRPWVPPTASVYGWMAHWLDAASPPNWVSACGTTGKHTSQTQWHKRLSLICVCVWERECTSRMSWWRLCSNTYRWSSGLLLSGDALWLFFSPVEWQREMDSCRPAHTHPQLH